MTIRLEVIGTPEPQGSKSGFNRGGKVVMVEGRGEGAKRFKSWREAVASAARDYQAEHRLELLDVPLDVGLVFRMPRPKSAPKSRLWPDTRPDVDKLERAVLDALTGTLITNDSRVCVVTKRKIYAVGEPPGCVITISAADDGMAVA